MNYRFNYFGWNARWRDRPVIKRKTLIVPFKDWNVLPRTLIFRNNTGGVRLRKDYVQDNARNYSGIF